MNWMRVSLMTVTLIEEGRKMEFTLEEIQAIRLELGISLIKSVKIIEKLEKLSNEEIGKLLFYHLWGNIEPLTPQSNLVMEAINRLGFVVPDDI